MKENDEHLNEQNNKNKKKLMQQNLRLVAELKRLQIEIEALDDVHREDRQDDSLLITLKNQTQTQQRQIKKLKELLQAEKHANIKENVIYIRKEEDQLIYLKKQLQNLEIERSLVLNAHSDKLKKLTFNEPLQKHKEELQNLWAKIKKQNRELNLKMVQMEREARKYHKMKEISKSPYPETINSNESEIVVINAEIERLNKQMKGIQVKWNNNIEQLDKEFFAQKNILIDFQQKIIGLEREQEIWKRRAGILRDQSELVNDRARLSKIVLIRNAEDNKFSTSQRKKQKNLSKNVVDDLQTIRKEKRLGNLATSLSRAESSPNPPTSSKHSSDIKLNILLVPGKIQDRQNSNKERAQASIGRIDFQKAKQLKSKEVQKIRNAKKSKNILKQSQQKSISFKEQVRQQNGKMSHREKHRIKRSATAQLAELLKRKAQEVKQLNKRLEIQQLKTTKDKAKNKQTKLQVMQVEIIPRNGKSKSKTQKQPQRVSNQKQAYGNSPFKMQRSQPFIQKQSKSANSIKSINKTKQLQNNREESKPKQKQLFEHLQLNNKKESLVKQQSQKSSAIVLRTQKEKEKIENISPQPKLPLSPKAESRKREQKPKVQVTKIVQNQLQKHRESIHEQQKDVKLSVKIELQDQEDDKPRLIKRRRPLQINLVTSGTST